MLTFSITAPSDYPCLLASPAHVTLPQFCMPAPNPQLSAQSGFHQKLQQVVCTEASLWDHTFLLPAAIETFQMFGHNQISLWKPCSNIKLESIKGGAG